MSARNENDARLRQDSNATCRCVQLILVHSFAFFSLLYSLLEDFLRTISRSIEGSCLSHTEEEGVDEAKVVVPSEAVFKLAKRASYQKAKGYRPPIVLTAHRSRFEFSLASLTITSSASACRL